MIIKTRRLPATQQHGEQMRATVPDTGATLTVPFPYGVESTDPARYVASALVRALTDGDHIAIRVHGQPENTFCDARIVRAVRVDDDDDDIPCVKHGDTDCGECRAL